MMFDDMPDIRTDQYPGIRRFYAREPARRSRAVTQIYEMTEAAIQARRTMLQMNKAHRPDIAAELEFTRENLLHDQLSFARKHLGEIKSVMDQVTFMPTLDALHEYATDRRRDRTLNRLLSRQGIVTGLKRSGVWDDIGSLKSALLDDLLRERNAFARKVMAEIESRKAEGG